jgi:small nuclear ribonucleoprotein (snRNP)-like protein
MTSLNDLDPSDFIGTELRITVNDGRVLKGLLLALDNKPNLLINNCIEWSIQRGQENSRDLGLVSVPNDSIKSIEIKKRDLDKTLDWKSTELLQ